MAKRIGSRIRKSRSKITKSHNKKGKISMTNYFATFNPGDKVILAIEPAVQKGSYPLRYHGKPGTVMGKQGRCFEVKINDQGKEKTLIVHAVHLMKAK